MGLSVLADEGPQALTIARMCMLMKRTKGAFYHHFNSAEEFHAALLDHWQQRLTATPIEWAERGRTRHSRRQRLRQAVSKLDSALDLAVRAWAAKHSYAAERLAEVDVQRMAYLRDLQCAAGVDRKTAELLAHIEYAAFVGAQQLFGNLSTPAAGHLDHALGRALELLASDLSGA